MPRIGAPLPRLAVFGLVGIIVPAATVAVLGYVSLRHWESSTELRFQEQARDMAVMTADKVQMVLRQADDEVLARLETALAAGRDLDAATADFRAETPLIERLSLFEREGRRLYPKPENAEGQPPLAVPADVAQSVWQRGGRRPYVAGDQPALAAIVPGPGGAPLLAAFTRSPEGLRREVFEATIKPLETPTICAVLDAEGRPVYSQRPVAGAHLLVAVPFREDFPGWRMALYQPPGTSPGESVRRQVMVFTAAFGVLVLVIAAGIVATWRLVRRETEMARLKADFVANVSHDLKTPLSVIRMFGETLEMDRVRDEGARREYYRVIARESERLTRLIDNVLDFSRIESGQRTYAQIPTAVEPVIRETLEAFSLPLANEGFKVDVQVAPDLPEVPLDADALGQALANLVDNAIKYSGERKSLMISAGLVGEGLAITVADEGIGIPREEHSRIFEKFYRVGRSETQGRRGSGVGLALVRHVADAHGGRVSVDSRPGTGSRFTLWLPLTRA